MADTAIQAFLPSYEVQAGCTKDSLETAVGKLCLVGDVVLSAVDSAEKISAVKEFAQNRWCRVEGITDVTVASDLLNSAVTQLIVDESHFLNEESWPCEFPKDRIMISLSDVDFNNLSDVVAKVQPYSAYVGGVVLNGSAIAKTEEEKFLEELATVTKGLKGLQVVVNGAIACKDQFAMISKFDKTGAQAKIAAPLLLEDNNLADVICEYLTTDRPDGLWSTIVIDESHKLLGMAFSSKQSIQEALRRTRGIYQSRKRGLWVKGDTSGNHQDLLSLQMDCDRDALVFVVKQHGDGFCHRNSNSCFAQSSGFTLLGETLQQRLANAPEGSYTQKLFNDAGMLKSKLIEEAIELSEATEKTHVANEAADLFYFAMVACTRAGVDMSDVESVLDRRHLKIKRRAGNTKPEFLAKHLAAQKAEAVKPPQPQEAKAPPTPAVVEPVGPVLSEASPALRRIKAEDIPSLHRDPVDPFALKVATEILDDIRKEGEPALLRHAIRLGDVKANSQHVLTPPELKVFYDNLPDTERAVLDRTAARIKDFAQAQRNSVSNDCKLKILGGECGQDVAAVEVAGCYAPGGRYPLPSSVLMGAVTARVAGVKTVWVASPRPQPIVCAAAYVAGADGLLMVGGAQAIGAFAYGSGVVPICDAIVGPGNMFVTAAKSLVAGAVAIDMLAGPSECLVITDDTANAQIVAADLLAQSEHDVAARAILVSTSEEMIAKVDAEVKLQLATLPTAETAAVAIARNSFAVLVANETEAAEISNRIAPEHLEVHTSVPQRVVDMVEHYGALFIGQFAAEVLGDYGAGPNHTLPTGGTARSYGGLSVHTFLRQRTWLRIDDCEEARVIIQDAVDLALCEGLHGHSRAAALRLQQK